MRVFLTGASGFIGCYFVRQALIAGHEVAALAMPEDSLGRLGDGTRDIRVVRGNLIDSDTYRVELEKWAPDVCIHLAWYTEPGKYLESPENIVCLNAGLHLVQNLIQVGCPRVVMAFNTKRVLLAERKKTQGALARDDR